MSIYKGIPLSSDGLEFRLLHLHPAYSKDAPIVCHLTTATFDSLAKPSYEALSYCWETTKQKFQITCNDQIILITENLWQALSHLRQRESHRTLWIDAICINQNNLAERSKQVSLMGRIYSTSTQVIAWLGPEPYADGTHQMFELAHSPPKIDPWQVEHQLGPLLGPALTKTIAEGAASRKRSKDRLQDEVWTQAMLDGVAAAMKRSWWTRTWVVQELTLAPKVTVMCGDLTASWPDFRHAFAISMMPSPQADGKMDLERESVRLHMDDSMAIASSRVTSAQLEEERKATPSRELADLLQTYRWSKATDERDKVYGLLGLAKSTYGIIPDYNMSVVSCYIQTTFAIIQGSGSLDILRSVIRPSCVGKKLQDLPSWVPGWSYDISDVPKEWQAQGNDASFFKPVVRDTWISNHQQIRGLGYPPEKSSGLKGMSVPPKLSLGGRILTLHGYTLTRLKLVGQKLEYHKTTPEARPTSASTHLKSEWKGSRGWGKLMDTVREWEHIAMMSPHIRTQPNESKEDAFLTTIYKNRFHDDQHRAETLKHARSCKHALLKPFKSVAMLKSLGLGRFNPELYHTILGFRNSMSLNGDDEFGFIAAFTLCLTWAIDQRLGRSEDDHLVLLPHEARVGDQLTLFEGGRTPFVIRSVGERWHLVGDCYVHGIMSGEAWDVERCVNMKLC